MFVDVENSKIHKGHDRTNRPCQMANSKKLRECEILEAEVEEAWKTSIELQALRDYTQWNEKGREV
jgi:hypothetical protein